MWTRVYKLRATRRLDELQVLIEELCGSVGWLQGEQVVLVAAGVHNGIVRLRFFKHSDWCNCDLSDNPDKPIKQKLKWISRYCR